MSSSPVNAMTVDVEEYFQVSAFETSISRTDWSRMDSRVESSIHRILELFANYGICATFFVLGWIAERNPALVKRIVQAGHEIASHGYDHTRVVNQDPTEFRKDVEKTKKLLEDLSGSEVVGYRAASYSINKTNLWALDALSDIGYRYSSSIYPIKHDLYGIPDAPRFAFRLKSDGILEIPVSTTEVLGRRIPCGGGGFFRLFPYSLSKWAIERVNRRDGQSAIFYFHPWELDPEQPRITKAGLKSRFRHYLNLGKTQARLSHLLRDFRWDRADRIFGIR